MFGYVIADLGRLTEAQRLRYHSVYCGLCRALYADYGAAGALALTYDMTFLTLLLAALYEPEERSGAARCLRHPVRAQQWASSEFTAYAAAMNCLLAWENCRDDWADEKKLSAAAAGGMLAPGREEGRGAVPGEGGGHPPRARADRTGRSGPDGLFRDPGQRLRGPDGGAVYGAGRPVDRRAAALCAQPRQADLFYGRRLRPAGG